MQERYLTITKSNSIPDFYSGRWKVYLPQEFYSSENPIKRIDLVGFLYFNDRGQLDIGTSCHASFNYDSVENDQMICMSCYGQMNQKSFIVRKNITQIEVWFKDYKGRTVFPIATEEYFLIELNLIF